MDNNSHVSAFLDESERWMRTDASALSMKYSGGLPLSNFPSVHAMALGPYASVEYINISLWTQRRSLSNIMSLCLIWCLVRDTDNGASASTKNVYFEKEENA